MNDIISWNLPPWIIYTPIPGIVLPIVVILTNPNKVQRQYSLIMWTWQNGQVICEEPVTIDESQYLQLEGYESTVVYSDIAIPVTDVIIELAVIDDTGKHIASVTSQLLSSVSTPVQVTDAIPTLLALAVVNMIIIRGV